MDLTARVSLQFHDSADAIQDALESLAAPIATAIEAITATLLDSGKILACCDSPGGCDASRLAALLVHGFDVQRPSLAALALDVGLPDDSASLARQVQALGHPGDVLVAICAGPAPTAIIEAIAAAHARDMRVIALSGTDGDTFGELLLDSDIHLHALAGRRARIQELHLLILHCLCDGIDCLLLGVED